VASSALISRRTATPDDITPLQRSHWSQLRFR
jgi:hypothetical protein